MTRGFPANRLLQTPPNGWQHRDFHPSRFEQENLINIGNASSPIVFPIACQTVREAHPAGIFHGENPLSYYFSLLLFELLLLITITRIVRFLLKPLKQPKVISQIIGGIILGPSVLRHSRWFENNIIRDDKVQFLMNNLGIMGFMFFLFVYGVKMDPTLLKKSGKMHVYIALIGISTPSIAVFVVALFMRNHMDKELSTISSLGGLACYMGFTAFHVLYYILQELNLLSSDIGRMALSTALIGDALGVSAIVVFEAGQQGETGAENALWYVISLVILVAFMGFCIRPAMEWIIENTPQGHPVDQSYVVAILLGVFVMGFLTDMFGMAIANGSLWLGLAIPDGPPLGAALVQKTETIMTEFLLPFSFMLVGSYTDVFAMSDVEWSNLAPLFFMVLTGYLVKFFSTWIAAIYWRMPFRDGLTFSLMMSLRGQIELIFFVHLMDKRILKVPGFTLLVLTTTILTATLVPLISIFYDPTRPYMLNQRRNIQHNPSDSELKIVLAILETESISGLINLLKVSNPTSNSPLSIYAVRLIELVGRSTPLFIDHEDQDVPPIYEWTCTINALKRYHEPRADFVKLQFFTDVGPKRTMFQDICELALEHEASLIILPFNKGGVNNHGVRTVNSQVLNHAPCSVGILVDKGQLLDVATIGSSFRRSINRFAVLFLGGADSREALVYADRMVANEDVSILTVIRFLSHNYVGDNEREKKLDDGIVTWFWVKNETNQRVTYREVVVRNGEETIAAIQAMNDGAYDLLIVGRKHGINPVLTTGLSDWSENEELGLIGDYVSSADFFGSASVLVVQQQILRG